MRQPDAPSTPTKIGRSTSQKGPESAEATSQKCRGNMCCLCQKVQVKRPIKRCRPCSTVYNCVQYYITRMDQGSKYAWANIAISKKTAFIRLTKNLDLFGRDLRAMLQIFVDGTDANLLERLQYIRTTRMMLNLLYEDMQYISGEKRERCDLAEEAIRLGRRDQRNQREATKEN